MTKPPMTPSIQVSEDTLAFEILNRHCEYHDGLSRGQRFVGADNALAAVREALAMKAVEQPLVLDEVREALAGILPRNVCLTNRNVRDDTVVPLECSMGDLRRVAAAISAIEGLGDEIHG